MTSRDLSASTVTDDSTPLQISAPRVVTSITVKRNVALAGRSYGHWWVEHGEESYGWWPSRRVGLLRAMTGVPGVLNGIGVGPKATATRDPNHGLPADYEFHPVVLWPVSDDALWDRVRTFALEFRGEWRWSTRVTMNCRLFQLELFESVGIVDGTGNFHSRGDGCPALASARRTVGRILHRRLWPWNLPVPGESASVRRGRRRRRSRLAAAASDRPSSTVASCSRGDG